MTIRIGHFAIAALFSLLMQGAWAAPADEVKALMAQGKSAEAYNWGRQFPDQLGNPQFDFYFGVAAVDAGHAGEGVLALERYLLTFPGSNEARLELARGYYVLGDLVRSREEFTEVSKGGAPASVQATIDRYLEAIRLKEARYTATTLIYGELGVGTDSNVNGGVGNSAVNLPNFGLVTIAPAGIKQGDNYANIALGILQTEPVAPGVAVFGGLAFEEKKNANLSQYNQGNFSGTGGDSVTRNDNYYRANVTYNTVTVDNNRYRNVAGVTGEWHNQVSEMATAFASVQYADLHYIGANQVRDAQLWSGAAGWRQILIGKLQPVIQGHINYGTEANQENRPDLGRDISGIRVSAAITPAAQWGLSVGLGVQESRYTGADPTLQVKRYDRYSSADFTVSYKQTKNLTFIGEALVSDNYSNIELYKYNRNVAAFKVRYEFK